ncbi:benzoate/H(+) symporter BenE family transporter [Gordonia pseudamarae]|uniref:Benzoate/H(+) symporter BenE family transporter n=1 Tax=Gordonia pseudamarae TaxID=2831662 RepID=A0ABX6IJ85_9ACTN|nr:MULTISPECIES: benzoate/H(+) symporter BenE family transporter [Gordonia]MBD0022635.1 benzoate/H(+) symporter BenE family transporter [Gordonia sp. (in: high G+C Gram-positive bacteria)]QHN26810.1 benzoate/H(+) symporter BenE family transporter [Gordonia pseudamarae]QHN35701.1 benzoate/H(+) symporter BenE family transporter [Gordonia pseudamarae]
MSAQGSRSHTAHSVITGVAAALIGYTSTFAVVLTGLQTVGADRRQATTGLVALCFAIGVVSLWLSRRYRMPLTIAWSTPGAAVLVSAGQITGGWAAAVGAFIVAALLVVVTGLWPGLGRLVAAIPAPIAQAMLAGILLDLCLTPVSAVAEYPAQVAPILIVWLAAFVLSPRWAIVAAFVTALVVVAHDAITGDAPSIHWLPEAAATMPSLTWSAVVSIALPLYIVTMAAQNVPGVAIMSSYGFTVPWRAALTATGLGSAVAAPFGAHAVNLAAITAALPASDESHPDPAQRWRTSATLGIAYLTLAVTTSALISFLAVAPAEIIATVAGLGLLGTLGSSLRAALVDESVSRPADCRTAAVITFVVAASGTTIAGISSSFWALIVGLAVYGVTWRPLASSRIVGHKPFRS